MKDWKSIGVYVSMLNDVLQSARKLNNEMLVSVCTTERKLILKNVANETVGGVFYDEWLDWGSPNIDDENFYFFRLVLEGYSKEIAYQEYLDLAEGLYREQ